MRVSAVSWPRVTLWPQSGLVSLSDSLVVEVKAPELRLLLPRGMRSDLASVPNPLWGVLEATPAKLALMGVAHDGSYRIDAAWDLPDGSRRPIERPEADDLAQALALWSGCSTLDGMKIRWGLGVGGAGSWHRKRLDWKPQGG